MTTCNSCGATYDTIQPGGLRYFHQCAPLSDHEIAAALGLPEDPALWLPAEHVKVAKHSRVRKNARNENAPAYGPAYELVAGEPMPIVITDWRAENERRDVEIVSDGAGVTPIDDDAKGIL